MKDFNKNYLNFNNDSKENFIKKVLFSFTRLILVST